MNYLLIPILVNKYNKKHYRGRYRVDIFTTFYVILFKINISSLNVRTD